MQTESSIRVLARPAFANRAKNPYNWLLYRGLQHAGVRVAEYSLASVVSQKHDIFHVHWPESTFNASLAEARVTTQALLACMRYLRARGTQLVWTAHNLRSHEHRYPAVEAAFFESFIELLDGVVALSESAIDALYARYPQLRYIRAFVVPHHHYRGEYTDTVSRSAARRTLGLSHDRPVLLFFGRIAPYKNVPELIARVRRLRLPAAKSPVLVVAGNPVDRAARDAVVRAAAGHPRVLLHLGFIEPARAQLYFRATDVVALPYREILNSGSAVLALSFDRPVLMPDLGAGQELARLVGREWVHTYESLEGAAIERALTAAQGLPDSTDGAQLAALSPELAVAQTHAIYRSLLSASRGRVPATGRVPSVAPYLERARVYANPLFAGTGTSLKVLEALASWVPLVSTAVGVRGFALSAPDHYLAAETAEAFVAQILACFEAPETRDRAWDYGRRFAEAHDFELIASRFVQLVQSVPGATRGSPSARSVHACGKA